MVEDLLYTSKLFQGPTHSVSTIYRSTELDQKKYFNTRNQCLELLKTKRLVVSTQKVVQ